MSVDLLDKTRLINKLLQDKQDNNRIIFNDLCKIIGGELGANVMVITNKTGKLLGIYNNLEQRVIDELLTDKVGNVIDEALNRRLSNILSTKENVNLATLGFSEEAAANITAIVSPILISGKRLGHLFIYRSDRLFNIEDIIIAEYGSTVIGLETMRAEKEELETERIKKATVEAAFNTLSESEVSAVKSMLGELNTEKEGILVASKIADQIGITRSIIVNALRKLESAGIVESRSAGMRGTYIKIVNDYVFDIFNFS
jgi:transcriptional pleiotropic repressor